MKYNYIIEIDGWDYEDDYNYTLDKCFATYELAEIYLLEHFEYVDANNGCYFKLKDGHDWLSKFSIGDTAEIKKLELMEDK